MGQVEAESREQLCHLGVWSGYHPQAQVGDLVGGIPGDARVARPWFVAVRAYKDLSKVERAFRSFKAIDLKSRLIHHWLDERIRAHVFLCMLACYVEWHLREKLAPILFHDEDRQSADAGRNSVVDPAPRSQTAKDKDASKRTADEWPVHSFQTLLKDLGTLAQNVVCIQGSDRNRTFPVKTNPTAFQQRVFDISGVTP